MIAAAGRLARREGWQGGRWLSTSQAAQDVLRFCVVGSGPAGFYTVDKVQFVTPPGRGLCVSAAAPPAVLYTDRSPLPRVQLLKRFGEEARVDVLVRPPAQATSP
jgi:hypothetical protein